MKKIIYGIVLVGSTLSSALLVNQLVVAKPAVVSNNASVQVAQQIFQQISQQNLVRANFSQQKKLSGLNKSFISSGKITFAKNQGVLWQISTPVQADLIMTQTALVQKTANTQSKIRLDQNQYAGVANIFMQLMAGDQKALLKNFNLQQVSKNGVNWQISLTPKSAIMQKLFNQVDVSGHNYVQKIVIREKNNSITNIQFSQHRSAPEQLTGQENALFKLAK